MKRWMYFCRVASTLEVGDEAGVHLVPGGDRAWSQVQEPGAGLVLERHGKPVRHDLLISVGGLDAQLVELEELCRVSHAIIARRQVWLELAGPRDAAQLGGEGAAARRGHRGPWATKSLVLRVPMRRGWRQRRVLTCWSRERSGSFSRARDFLAALLLPCRHLTERVPPRGHAPS